MLKTSSWKIIALGWLALGIPCMEALAEKRDFRGLFGSYRREQYVENEANSSDLGVDFMLSTLLPVSTTVTSNENTTTPTYNALNYAVSFNLEASIFYTLGYHWELFFNVGYYSYETRKENASTTNSTLPLFHEYEMTMFPAIAGLKYRFSTNDIVPYVGLGAGLAYTIRRVFYDHTTAQRKVYDNALAAQFTVGLEFFFSARAGIRLEMSGQFVALDDDAFVSGGIVDTTPDFQMKGNFTSVRYASGIFFLL